MGILLITTLTLLLEIPSDTWLTSATLSMILGAAALAYMAVSCLLASRWRAVENVFSGLDRVYETHKWLGVWALIFATYHFVFKANLDVWNSVPILELPKYWTRLVRQLSYVALGLIVLPVALVAQAFRAAIPDSDSALAKLQITHHPRQPLRHLVNAFVQCRRIGSPIQASALPLRCARWRVPGDRRFYGQRCPAFNSGTDKQKIRLQSRPICFYCDAAKRLA